MPGPLITIKHPDGTIEKISLEDFRARQKAKQASVVASVVVKAEPVKVVSRPEGTASGLIKKSEPVKPEPAKAAPVAIPAKKPEPVPPAPLPVKIAPPKPAPTPIKSEPVKKTEPVKPVPAQKKEAPKPYLPPQAKPVIPVSAPVPKVVSRPEGTPSGPAVKTEKSAGKFTKDDAKSLLEEELPAAKSGVSLASKGRAKEAEEIYKKLNFSLAPDTRNRLLGLIELRLKDVRSEDEINDWLILPEKQMGIGLTGDKAKLVLTACREYSQKNISSAPADVVPLKRPLGMPTALAKEDREPFPANATPNNAFVHAPPQPQKPAPRPISQTGGLAPSKDPVSRPIVRDISPATPANLGPVDEVKYITLVDFRRLSSNAGEAASRLKQKFLNMKEESYILFLNCMEAWRQSPLFLEHVGAVTEALNGKKKLADVTADKNRIQMSEIQALIQMEKELL